MNQRNNFKVDTDFKKKRKISIFSIFDKILKRSPIFYHGMPISYFPKVIFIVFFGLIYIWNSHYTERITRKIDKIEVKVEDLRANYTTLKSNYMYASKQSEVAKKVKSFGLVESLTPPNKIVIRDGEY